MAQDGKNKKHFFKEFKAELKKVIWPTPKQLVNGTIAVITIVLIVAALVFALDSTFNFLNQKGIHRVQEYFQSKESVNDNGLKEPEEEAEVTEVPIEVDTEDESDGEEAE